MSRFSDVEAFVNLVRQLDPDPVDVFEDLLAARLGLARHPRLSQGRWRQVRVAFIEAAGEHADQVGRELADQLLAHS